MQTNIKSVHEVAEAYGFRFTGTCQCDGLLTQKFERTEQGVIYQIRWRKNRYLFRVTKNREPINEWSPVAAVETFIKNLHEIKEPAASDPGTVS